jgi:hypothetical protein
LAMKGVDLYTIAKLLLPPVFKCPEMNGSSGPVVNRAPKIL